MKFFNRILFITFIISTLNCSFGQINEAVKFKITDSNGNTDELIIRLSNESTINFDPFWDAWKLFTPDDMVPSLYSQTAIGEALTINAIPVMSVDTVLSLYMRARIVGGQYLMETEQLGSFPEGVKMAIRDLTNGNIYELNQDQSFNFNVNINPVNDFARFEIFYSTRPTEQVTENDLSITNSGSTLWSYEILNNQQTSILSGNSVTETLNLMDFQIGDYNIVITDTYNLVDTVSFSIEFEDEIIEEDTTITIGEDWQNFISSVNENPLIISKLIKTNDGYMIDLSNSLLSNFLKISTYSLNGAIINQQIISSNENVYIQLPKTKSYYLIVLEFEGEQSVHKVSGW